MIMSALDAAALNLRRSRPWLGGRGAVGAGDSPSGRGPVQVTILLCPGASSTTSAVLRVAGHYARPDSAQFRIRSALRSGRWPAALPGVVVLHNGPVSAVQLRRCAMTYAGPGSFLSHVTAAAMRGLRVRPDDRLHVTIPHSRHPRGHDFVVVHQSVRPCRLERNGDLRWSEPARTVVDVAAALSSRDDVRARSDAVQRRLVSVAQLEAAAAAVPRRGRRWLSRRSRTSKSALARWVSRVRFSVRRLIHDIDGVITEIRTVLNRAVAS